MYTFLSQQYVPPMKSCVKRNIFLHTSCIRNPPFKRYSVGQSGCAHFTRFPVT